MLHDAVMSRMGGQGLPKVDASEPQPELERRDSDRLPFPAEMVLVWNHDLQNALRYRVLDAGDGGYRIRSSLILLEGTTGMVLRLLPSRGQQLDQPVMVVWTRPAQGEPGFDIGLRCF
jgi:hypothetical protein